MNPSAVPAAAEDPPCHLVADDVMAQVNVPELEPATTLDGERDQDRDSGHNEEGEQDGDYGDEEEIDWYRDLMERFQIACRIVNLRFDIKEFIGTYFNTSRDPDLQRQAMRRLREDVERKKKQQQQQVASSQGGGDLSLADGDGDGDGGSGGARGGGGDDDDLDEQMEKFVPACGFADRMTEVDRIIDTYFDEDLDNEACQASIDQLLGKLDMELEARSNAVSTGKFRL